MSEFNHKFGKSTNRNPSLLKLFNFIPSILVLFSEILMSGEYFSISVTNLNKTDFLEFLLIFVLFKTYLVNIAKLIYKVQKTNITS